jgi:hypothetical protein
MTEQGASFAGKRGRGWAWVASWVVPVMMGGAYCVLIATSDVKISGALWEAGGFGLVLVFWFAFRILTRRAALARAIAVGDHARILELATSPIDRAIAHELRADWTAVLASLDQAHPRSSADHVIAAALRIHAHVETGDVARAHQVLDRDVEARTGSLDPRLHAVALLRAKLARGRVLAAEGKRDEAAVLLRRVIEDVRTGATTRAAAEALESQLKV